MQKRIKHVVLLIFSIIFSVGMLYALYTDLNFFLTRRLGKATILNIDNSNKSNNVSLQLAYYNDYLKENVKSTISLKQNDATQITEKGTSQTSILYTKYYPYKIYIENINAPRWPILIFEVIMILLMFFLFYSSIKNLAWKQAN